MQIVLFEDSRWTDLKPFTFTRSVADIRIGILTLREKWEKIAQSSVQILTREYLSPLYPGHDDGPAIYINSALIPDRKLWEMISQIQAGQRYLINGRLAFMNSNEKRDHDFFQGEITGEAISSEEFRFLGYSWDIFSWNDSELRKDFSLLTEGRSSAALSATNQLMNAGDIFLEEGAKVECSIINATTGPVYIGKDAEIMEGCIIRGPFALGDHAVLKMGTRIYGATTIGPGCRAGGEISNSVLFANSNKAHDGFLGNSVIGEWCNLGADTNNSNLKNNYSEVSAWNYTQEAYIKTGLQFCGLFMGDHSKCGINTMFNTGTTVGVFANVFGAGFPEKYIPGFTWGGTGSNETFLLDKAVELAARVMARRGKSLSEEEKKMIDHLYMEQLKPLPGSED